MCGGNEKPPAEAYATPDCFKPVPLDSAQDGDLVVEEFPLTYEDYTYPHSRIAYIKGRGPVPVVLVHHNYAGLKQFDIDQACYLAKAGYVGLAVDSYIETPDYSFADRNPLRSDGEEMRNKHFRGAFSRMNDLLWRPGHWRGLMAAYLEAAFKHPAVAEGLAGAIGYCLGGQACLEQLRAGHQLQAIVTFHGLLNSRPMYKEVPDCYNAHKRLTPSEYAEQVQPPPTTCSKNCVVVIENGAHDDHVPVESIVEFMTEMDSHDVDWRFNNHARTPHGWALGPGVTATSYCEQADRRSTLSMLAAFAEVWPECTQFHVEMNASGTTIPAVKRASSGTTTPAVKRARSGAAPSSAL
eukprot:gb/GFBE01043514.1/.p1 GENE.gb/GFBE01043514.1/~~gb/GFBE01043514.1/.p1  ORF type:complete len:353 (+),score=56.34 gb/GFBE01043514.1/:1-1059(+)